MDKLVKLYQQQLNNHPNGASSINPRVAIGAVIIKHICELTDRATIHQIQENMYMQYFIGYSSFSNEEPFDASLFVSIRMRLNFDLVGKMNEMILDLGSPKAATTDSYSSETTDEKDKEKPTETNANTPTHSGTMITDATAAPQDISYPTDLNLLNDAREKAEKIIDILHAHTMEDEKPPTYRKTARKIYLKTAQKKTKTTKEIRKAIRKQLNFLHRDIQIIHKQLDQLEHIPLAKKNIQIPLGNTNPDDQQKQMYDTRTHTIQHRIVSIHQPQVRPIVRGKANARVEFGSKINVSLNNGYTFLDHLSWEAFNEGKELLHSVEQYKARWGYYPKEVLVDKIYCTRENRAMLKELGIQLKAKPLGRPKAVTTDSVSPGERNPIQGKFGQAKRAYGLNRVRATLQLTSESWIASIILVLNLVKLAGVVPYCLFRKLLLTYSASCMRITTMTVYDMKINRNRIFMYNAA